MRVCAVCGNKAAFTDRASQLPICGLHVQTIQRQYEPPPAGWEDWARLEATSRWMLDSAYENEFLMACRLKKTLETRP